MRYLILLALLVGCEYHTHRIFWYCGNHKPRHIVLDRNDIEAASKKDDCKDWYPINETVQ